MAEGVALVLWLSALAGALGLRVYMLAFHAGRAARRGNHVSRSGFAVDMGLLLFGVLAIASVLVFRLNPVGQGFLLTFGLQLVMEGFGIQMPILGGLSAFETVRNADE